MPLKTRITDARHNAATGCFEAHVTLIDGIESFTYSVSHCAPIDSDTSGVKAALIARARLEHRPEECRLTRRRVSSPIAGRHEDIAKRILLSQPNYLEQILARHASGPMREA